MSDLTDRLRCFDRQTCTEAAERIEALEAQLAAMRAGGEPVAQISGIDEYGPMLGWFKHWKDVAIGAPLYTHPQPAAQDAERLDWLGRAGPTSICLVMDRQHDGEIEVSPDDGPTGYGKTLRAAIDAAIAAQQGDSHE